MIKLSKLSLELLERYGFRKTKSLYFKEEIEHLFYIFSEGSEIMFLSCGDGFENKVSELKEEKIIKKYTSMEYYSEFWSYTLPDSEEYFQLCLKSELEKYLSDEVNELKDWKNNSAKQGVIYMVTDNNRLSFNHAGDYFVYSDGKLVLTTEDPYKALKMFRCL